ncbi:MAG: iron-sulfur cluster assembly accessory protein [Thiothrix sp.]|jgi:iron-sulfur cluster assembly accessory protein|uniref:HesB/IscA family protein n=1 Tax=Thiothrix sp. TaxID=1032 RepID=UPI00260AF89E|nr:iron-sulfur cluster assembly accessory protein [Thiothrix sp.]MDD5394341.1 iron-sulfur cluster assembly accessory protein [Thiothrix sp.]
MITLTEKAQKALGRFIKNSETPVAGLRIGVSGGGCSGLQYSMNLVEAKAADDLEVNIGNLSLFIDPASAPKLDGLTVDFIDTMTESGFRFDNPNATNSCGCGKSFSA